MTGERFRADGTETLGPSLRRGDAIILDNLGAHKVTGVREALEAVGRGCSTSRRTRPTSTRLSGPSPS